MPNGSRAGSLARGFAYLMLLGLVAVIGVAAAGTVAVGHSIGRRSSEAQLLDIGLEFKAALASYAAATPPGSRRSPMQLEELLRDPRVPGMRRHLRLVRADPLTGSVDWGLLRDESGGIVAIYSKAEGVPIKRTGFPAGYIGFDDAPSYAAWRFGTVRPGLLQK